MGCDKKYDLITITSKCKDIITVISIAEFVSKSELSARTKIVIQWNRNTIFKGEIL